VRNQQALFQKNEKINCRIVAELKKTYRSLAIAAAPLLLFMKNYWVVLRRNSFDG
jgi:hypothetical protein